MPEIDKNELDRGTNKSSEKVVVPATLEIVFPAASNKGANFLLAEGMSAESKEELLSIKKLQFTSVYLGQSEVSKVR